MARILHVLPAYLPATAWGGPVFSTAALCRAAVKAGHEVEVLTTDAADPETGARLSPTETRGRFPDGYRVTYARRAFGQSGSWDLLRRLPGMVTNADLVHLSMTYSFPSLPTLAACRATGTPIVWSPRGAIQATEDWADAPRKRLKTAFERLAQRLAPADTVLHVTARSEATATALRMPGFAVETIPNAVDIPETLAPRDWRPDGRLRLLFLSRLHPKKGLDTLIEALAALPDSVSLDIAGAGAQAYEAELSNAVARHGLADRVRFLGHIDGPAKAAAFAKADLFVLPTKSENFGIAVAEALAHGVPAVTTRAAPWEGLKTHRCGTWIPEGVGPLRAALAQANDIPGARLAEMGERGRAWMQAEFAEEVLGARMMALYDRLLEARP